MACRTCPLLARCTTAANTAPPEHYCVQAGEIWSGGRPMDVQIWLATQKNSNLRRDPITCPRCQARFLPRLPTQRYCRSTCRIADRQAVAS